MTLQSIIESMSKKAKSALYTIAKAIVYLHEKPGVIIDMSFYAYLYYTITPRHELLRLEPLRKDTSSQLESDIQYSEYVLYWIIGSYTMYKYLYIVSKSAITKEKLQVKTFLDINELAYNVESAKIKLMVALTTLQFSYALYGILRSLKGFFGFYHIDKKIREAVSPDLLYEQQLAEIYNLQRISLMAGIISGISSAVTLNIAGMIANTCTSLLKKERVINNSRKLKEGLSTPKTKVKKELNSSWCGLM